MKIAFRPDDSYLAVALSNNCVKIYDMRNYKQLQVYKCHDGAVNSISFHSSGNYLLTGSADSTITILDLLEARTAYTIEGHEGPISATAFSRDGNYFATGGHDKQLLIWRTTYMDVTQAGEELEVCKEQSPPEHVEEEEKNEGLSNELLLIEAMNRLSAKVTNLAATVENFEKRLDRVETTYSLLRNLH